MFKLVYTSACLLYLDKMPIPQKNKRIRKVKLLYSGPVEQCDSQAVYQASFGQMTPGERCKAAWELVELAWKLKGRKR